MELLTTSSPSVIDWVWSLHLELSNANVHDVDLVHLLDKMRFLEKILSTLYEPSSHAGDSLALHWTKFPFPLQAALARVIKLQSMSYLTLSNLGIIPLSSIFPFSSATHLNVFSCGFSPPSPNHEWGSRTRSVQSLLCST